MTLADLIEMLKTSLMPMSVPSSHLVGAERVIGNRRRWPLPRSEASNSVYADEGGIPDNGPVNREVMR